MSLTVLALLVTSVAAQEAQVNARGTYLRTDPNDNPGSPTVVNLDQLGYLPGQTLRMSTVGDFSWNPGNPQLLGLNAVAVFSSSTSLLSTNDRFRVVGAIACGAQPYVTADTFQTNLQTDIPEDFSVTPVGISVTIPDNGSGRAPYLLIGADDVFWGDNLDADSNFGVVFERPLDQQLLRNGSFETGTTAGWTGGSGIFIQTYGPGNTPLLVSSQIQGGFYYVAGFANLTQTIDLSGNSSAIDSGNRFLELTGYFGGQPFQSPDYSYSLEATFLDVLQQPILPVRGVGYIGDYHRLRQDTLLKECGRFPVPPGTRGITFTLRCNNPLNQPGRAHADNLQAVLRTSGQAAPLSIGSNLVTNGDFESGQILTPQATSGWKGDSQFPPEVLPYGTPTTPSFLTSSQYQGGSYVLQAPQPSNLIQQIDCSGSSATIDNSTLHIHLSGHFGGYQSEAGSVSFGVRFLNSIDAQIRPAEFIGGIVREHRFNQTVPLKRDGWIPVPAGTRKMELILRINAVPGERVHADNLSAVLSTSIPSLPYGTPLMSNGGFETGNVLDPSLATSWSGYAGTSVQLGAYGGPGMPSGSVANAIGGGTYLAKASSASETVQWIDLSGNASGIDSQSVSIHVEGWFGGSGSGAGSLASLRVEGYTRLGGPTGSFVIGNVTPADRSNITTLLHRTGDFLLPFGTRRVAVILRLNDGNALADNLSAQLVDSSVPLRFPGTGDGLMLLSGINALPSGGPGADTKTATPGNIVSFRIEAPSGVYAGAPLLFAGNLFVTGTTMPSIGLPGIHLNPVSNVFFWLLDGVTPNGIFGPSTVVPGGSSMNLVVPSGLTGASILIQAIALHPASVNSIYASSEGHEIRFQ